MSGRPSAQYVPCYSIDVLVQLTLIDDSEPLIPGHVYGLPTEDAAILLRDTQDGDVFILLGEHEFTGHVCRRVGDAVINCLCWELHEHGDFNWDTVRVVVIPPDRLPEVNAVIHKRLYLAGGLHNAWIVRQEQREPT